MKHKGMFITFEGGEGCGKSTHSLLLKKYLISKGRKVLLTREPGGTEIGKGIRDTLLSTKSKLVPNTELLLFAADRNEHVQNVILPALNEGKIVICDRFVDSTVAYQVGGRLLKRSIVYYLNELTSSGLVPDLTLLLDINPKEGLKRGAKAKGGKDRFEREKLVFHNRIRREYLNIAKKEPYRVFVINSQNSMDKVKSVVFRIIDAKLKRGKDKNEIK